jgi:hypothetical protein
MAQHDYDIANQTFPNFRTDLNNVLQAILTNNSGGTAPTVTAAGMIWIDTSGAAPLLKVRDNANTAWITLLTLADGQQPLSLVGGTLTGDLLISKANPSFVLAKTGAAQDATIFGRNGAANRWSVSVGTTGTESGGNAGSDFQIGRWTDAGTFIDAPLAILRGTGAPVFASPSLWRTALGATATGSSVFTAADAAAARTAIGAAPDTLTSFPAYFQVNHEAAGNAASPTTSAWTAVPLNTTKFTALAIPGITWTAGTFTLTLPAGTYRMRGNQVFGLGNDIPQIRLQNLTGSTTLATSGAVFNHGDRVGQNLTIEITFAVTTNTDVRMEYYVNGGNLGRAASSGAVNTYGTMVVEKLL